MKTTSIRRAGGISACLIGFCLLLAMVDACEQTPRESAALEQPAAPLPKLIQRDHGGEVMEFQVNQIPGLTTARVREVEMPGVLETSGQISFDDRRVSTIISRVAGRIEQTRISQWDFVRRGEPILVLYSPDIMTAEAEYLQARETAAMNLGGPGAQGEDQLGRSMVEAARRKMELLGLEPDQIAAVKTAAPTFTMRAPISGTVVDNKAVRGAQVNPGDVLYSLGTLEYVWVIADIYESDVARVHVGQALQATIPSFPGETFSGVVDQISPNVDPNTHTIQVRCRIPNPGLRLKPQMLARVRIVTQPGQALVVPQDALVFDIDSYFAFVLTGADLVERRRVTIGSWNEQGFARVLGGLAIGERIIDHETIQVDALWHQAHGESS